MTSAARATRPAANKWIITPQPNPDASLRLFCFPYAGGGVAAFRAWPALVPPYIEVCAVQLPGRETRLREPLFTSLAPLAEQLVEVLAPYCDKPFAFFGHSMGALICFELARSLRRAQQPMPKVLFVSARRAPQAIDPDPPLYKMPEPEFLAELQKFNGTPTAVLQNPELLQMVIPTLRADFSINESYVYTHEAALDMPIVAFGGAVDPIVHEDDLREWRQQTINTFMLRMLPGDHFFLQSAQPALIHTILQYLQII